MIPTENKIRWMMVDCGSFERCSILCLSLCFSSFVLLKKGHTAYNYVHELPMIYEMTKQHAKMNEKEQGRFFVCATFHVLLVNFILCRNSMIFKMQYPFFAALHRDHVAGSRNELIDYEVSIRRFKQIHTHQLQSFRAPTLRRLGVFTISSCSQTNEEEIKRFVCGCACDWFDFLCGFT